MSNTQHTETIAIIGAESEPMSIVVKHLINSPYHILLIDEAFHKEWGDNVAPTEFINRVERIGCCREASWEADVILLADDVNDVEAILEKVRDVASNKIVIILSVKGTDLYKKTQALLALSKIVNIEVQTASSEQTPGHYLITGHDAAATDFVLNMFEFVGLNTAAVLN